MAYQSSQERGRQAGDGVDVPVVKARSAERRGVIWILTLSLAAAVVALGAVWLWRFVGGF